MNRNMIISSILLLLVLGCKDNTKNPNVFEYNKSAIDTVLESKNDSVLVNNDVQKVEHKLKEVLPDSTINKILALGNDESLQKFYKDYKKVATVDRLRESPVAIFSNKDNSQYLLAYHYEGNTKNDFSCFEIGYFKDESGLNQLTSYNLTDNIFFTESKLSLGVSLEDIIRIKGDSYTTKNEIGEQIVTYRIDDYGKSPFLLRYNMPGYFMEFRLKNNKTTRITFGFDYP